MNTEDYYQEYFMEEKKKMIELALGRDLSSEEFLDIIWNSDFHY